MRSACSIMVFILSLLVGSAVDQVAAEALDDDNRTQRTVTNTRTPGLAARDSKAKPLAPEYAKAKRLIPPKAKSASPKILRFDWYGPNKNSPTDPFRLYPGETIEYTLDIQGPQTKAIQVQINSSNSSVVPVPSSISFPKSSSIILTKKFSVTIPASVNPPKSASVTASTTAGSKASAVSVQAPPEE